MIDGLDIRIIQELQENGRVKFREISRKHGISIGTVHNRLNKMMENGILKNIIPIIDYEKLGYPLMLITYISLIGNSKEKVIDKLNELSQVNVILESTGINQLILLSRMRSINEISQFENELKSIKQIQVKSDLITGMLKDEFYKKL